MCKYMIIKDEKTPMCDNGKMCTFCILGNSKTYNELENNQRKENVQTFKYEKGGV